MAKAKNGDKVKIHYTGTLNDGTVFDSSEDRDPLEFTLGSGQVIPGFDKGVLGMEVKEKKIINIPASEAYGERREELVITVPRNDLPENIDPAVGMQLQLKNQTGQTFNVVVSDLDEANISLDANHPLAGEDLNFDVELVEITA